MSWLARCIKASIESDRIPVPLFLGDRRIVSQMLPGRWRSCVLEGFMCSLVLGCCGG